MSKTHDALFAVNGGEYGYANVIFAAVNSDGETSVLRLALFGNIKSADDFYTGDDKNLRRRLTTFEYESVLREAVRLGFDGYMQSAESASAKYTPEFSDTFSIDLS